MDRLRDHVLPDPLDLVRHRPLELVCAEVGSEHGPFRVDRDDLHGRPVFLEVPADPAHGPAGPHGPDHRGEPLSDHRIDLGRGTQVVCLGIALVEVLVRIVGVRDLGGEALRDRVVAHRMIRRELAGGDDHPCAVRPEQADLLRAHLVRDDEDGVVPADRRHEGEADPGVAARRFDRSFRRAGASRSAPPHRASRSRCGP